MQPYVKMDEMRQKRLDHHMWHMGLYVNNAVYAAVSVALQGSKAHVRYFDAPLSDEQEKDSQQSDFEKFSAWAAEFNYNFESSRK